MTIESLDDYEVIKKIGETKRISLFKGKQRLSQKSVLLRHFSSECYSQHQLEIFAKEFQNTSLKLNQLFEPTTAIIRQKDGLTLVSDSYDYVPLSFLIHQQDLQIRDILQIIINVVSALEQLHQHHIIHKNITPNSILVNLVNFSIKLSGLGFLSKLARENLNITSPSQIEGDIHYISPEQTGRISRSVDYRSDFYSLGVVIYELLTGILPCDGDNVLDVIYCHMANIPEKPNTLDPTVPPVLSNIVMKLLEKSCDDRYQSSKGIRSDLQNCYSQLKTSGVIVEFEIGADDRVETLQFTEKLYGRQKQISLLESIFLKVSAGEKITVLISGNSGTGKTSLINELKHTLSNKNALFLSGKFEQGTETFPYHAFIEVFNQFSDYLKKLDEQKQQYWKRKIISALGDNISLVASLSPAMNTLFGTHENIVDSSDAELRNRFKNSLMQFIMTVASVEFPLVLIIDDLQWSDTPSVELFDSLVSSDHGSYLLLIGVYRENEISQHDELRILLESGFNGVKEPVLVSIDDLSKEDVSLFMQDILNVDMENVKHLAEQIYLHTGGNPYFMRQLLQNLDAEGFFSFDAIDRQWTWGDIGKIDASGNVVDITGVRLSRLDNAAHCLVKYAAVLGYRFLFSDLLKILDMDETLITDTLSTLIDHNFVVYHKDYYRFAHDRIQQAVLDNLSHEEKCKIHQEVGMALFKQNSISQSTERIYEITSHLNKGFQSKIPREFCQQLLELNIKSAEKALSETAYKIANTFANQATKCLPENAWKTDKKLAYYVNYLLTKTEYLIGEIDHAIQHIELLLNNADSYSNQVESFSLLKDIYSNLGKDYDVILQYAQNILRKNAIKFSLEEDEIQILIDEEHLLVNEYFKFNNVEGILDLPLLSGDETEFYVKFFMQLWEGAYYAGRVDIMQYCVLKMVGESLKHGNINESAFGYVVYASLLSSKGDYQNAYEIGRIALELNKRYDNKSLIPKLNNLFANYTAFHVKPFSESVDLYQQSLNIAKTNGDYLFGVWAALFYVWTSLLSGVSLDSVLRESNKHLGFVKQTHDKKILYAYRMLQLFILFYRGEISVHDYESEVGDFVKYWQAENFLPGTIWYAILEAQRLYDEKQYDKAIKILEQYAVSPVTDIVMFPISQYYFFYCLNLIARAKINNRKLSNEEYRVFTKSRNVINNWAETGKENFLFQKYILEAVFADLNGSDTTEALFNQALDAVEICESDYYKALCSELIAHHFLSKEEEQKYELELEKATYIYTAWGSEYKSRKVRQLLSTKYTDVTKTAIESDISDGKLNFDTLAIVDSIQAISSEINKEKLLEKMLTIIIKNTYAQKGVILECQDDSSVVKVVFSSGSIQHHNQDGSGLSAKKEIPNLIINDATESRKDIVLENAEDSQYANDEYIKKNRVKSLLCTPVYHQGHLIAVVYLENNLSTGLFNQEKLQFIHYLKSQIAISLENSRLYENLQSQIYERQKVEDALRVSEERMQRSQVFSNVGTWEWDIRTDSLYWSDHVKVIFGMDKSLSDIDINLFNETLHPEDAEAVHSAINECLEGKEYYVEHRIILPNGQVKWVAESGNVVRDINGKPVKMYGLVQDIDARKKAEEERQTLVAQLQQAQKMEAIGQLTGGIAHDFNNILASVLGYTGLAIKSDLVKSSEKLSNHLSEIKKAGERAKELIKQMLAFSREQEGEILQSDIVLSVKESIKMLSSILPSSLSINYKSDINEGKIGLSAVQLHQVIMNLCINARDAMMGIGKLSIHLSYSTLANTICDSCHKVIGGDYYQLVIKDNGEGITEEEKHRIFEPFYTTKEVGKGTGMGLSMVHGIVHSIGGHIKVNSEINAGTEFVLFFPILQKIVSQQQLEKSTKIESVESHNRKKVLVVDDEQSIVLFLEELLTQYGYDVVTYTSAKSALEYLRGKKNECDILITDQTMPEYTGLELAKLVLSENPAIDVVVTTGYSERLDESIVLEVGCKGLIRKPFEVDGLLELLHNITE